MTNHQRGTVSPEVEALVEEASSNVVARLGGKLTTEDELAIEETSFFLDKIMARARQDTRFDWTISAGFRFRDDGTIHGIARLGTDGMLGDAAISALEQVAKDVGAPEMSRWGASSLEWHFPLDDYLKRKEAAQKREATVVIPMTLAKDAAGYCQDAADSIKRILDGAPEFGPPPVAGRWDLPLPWRIAAFVHHDWELAVEELSKPDASEAWTDHVVDCIDETSKLLKEAANAGMKNHAIVAITRGRLALRAVVEAKSQKGE